MSKLFDELFPSNGVVIAEVACGHEGDPDKLRMLIDCVVKSQCDIIKFQIFITEERAVKGSQEWSIFSKLELSEQEWSGQVEYARENGLKIFADIYGQKSLEIAERLNIDAYKIHSEDLLNTNFILQVCETDKMVIIGVGGAKRKEINDLLCFLSKNTTNKKIVLMTGVQTFPTPVQAHSIEEVSDLIDKYSKYGIKVGFSDHVAGNQGESFILPFMAFSRGASIVEKHITFNRDDKWIDYHSALSANDFNKFIKQVKELCPLLTPVGNMNSYEKSYRNMFKKSPSFQSNFSKGYTIKSEDITFIKDTENSIPVSSIGLVDKKINKNVDKYQLIRSNRIDYKIGAIIVARCGSSRLPNKALLKIQGRESIALVIDRIKKCSKVGEIILATTMEDVDDQLVSIASREGIKFYRGSTDNVALRYYEAAQCFELDHFVRITGDAILCDELMIDSAIESHLYNSSDVTFMKNMPFGTHKEVVCVDVLKTIIESATVPSNTEYLEYYLENDRYFNVNYIESKYNFNRKTRITLDYEEDLEFFNEIFKYFNQHNPDFVLRDVLEWLEENEDIVYINSHKTQKTPINLNLDVSLSI